MEPTLIRRFFVGLLVTCLIVGAGAFGWAQGRSGRHDSEGELPAMGGIRAQGESHPGRETELVARERESAGTREREPAEMREREPAEMRETEPAQVREGEPADMRVRDSAGTNTSPAAESVAPSASGTEPRAQENVARGGGRDDPIHRVAQGETLFAIARRYGVQVADLQRANGLASDLIRPGQLLMVPGGKGPGSGVSLEGEFTWPVLAPISSPYGPRWGRLHKGIDLAANHGDSIRASRDGTVVLAGEVPGYGQTVILEHSDGSRTLYAHCSRLLVQEGERVAQGQDIALVGSTGQSTGPHLHFEIIVDGEPLDPLLFLPAR